jgi:hypothetical protein
VPSEIRVRVGTPHGLADESELLKLLKQATGLTWERREVPIQGMPGITEILVEAVVQVTTEMAFRGVVDKAKHAVEQWRGRRLKPPPISVEETFDVDDTASLD